MTKRLILLLLLVLLAPLPVAAQAPSGPSFDCQRARAWDERNICAFSDLAGLDRQIAAAWRVLNERASAEDRARLQAEQRTWLGERRACQGPVEREAVSCLRRVMRARARDLEAAAQAAAGTAGQGSSSTASAKPSPVEAAQAPGLRVADCARPAGWAAQRICATPGMRDLDAAVVREAAAQRARLAGQPPALAQLDSILARYPAEREACARAAGRVPVDCLQEVMEDTLAALRRRGTQG